MAKHCILNELIQRHIPDDVLRIKVKITKNDFEFVYFNSATEFLLMKVNGTHGGFLTLKSSKQNDFGNCVCARNCRVYYFA